MLPGQSAYDDNVALLKLVYVSCQFDAGRVCEARFNFEEGASMEGELRIRMTPTQAERLKIGDVYSVHLRRL
jgi:hypothetical protein